MTQDEIIEMAREAGIIHPEMVAKHLEAFAKLVAAKALTQEKALQALHSENERLGLYKDAYAQPEQEPVAWMDADGKTFPFVWNVSSLGVQQGSKYLDETLTPLYTTPPQCTEQEPVKIAHRHEWLRTGEMKVGQMRCISCGTWGQEDMPQRTWVGLTDEEVRQICVNEWGGYEQCRAIEAKLKEKNT